MASKAKHAQRSCYSYHNYKPFDKFQRTAYDRAIRAQSRQSLLDRFKMFLHNLKNK